MVGSHLSNHLLLKGYEVIILSRKTKKSEKENLHYALWDPEAGFVDEEAIKKADHIINLAGAGVADKRWATERKKEIIDSRVASGKLIVKALKEIPNNVKTVINASAIGWYGADTAESRKRGFREDEKADKHFLGETCMLWEQSIEPVKELEKRLIKFRIGIVLSEEGGAVKEFSKPVKAGIVPIFSKGDQVISWIHVDDLCRMFMFALDKEDMSGVFNAVSPQPVTNKQFMMKLAQKLRGKFFIPVHVPAFVLKLALGEMSIEVLKSATVSSEKIQAQGFTFLYPSLTAAFDLK